MDGICMFFVLDDVLVFLVTHIELFEAIKLQFVKCSSQSYVLIFSHVILENYVSLHPNSKCTISLVCSDNLSTEKDFNADV